MNPDYVIVYSEVVYGWVSSERKTALCDKNKLIELLNNLDKYTIWSVCWVNLDVDKNAGKMVRL